jgi:uncharacterized protein (TIGR03066 family)
MQIARIILALCAVLGLGLASRAEDKADNKKLLVGKWQVAKSDPGTLPAGSTVEFTADGKLKITVNAGGKEETIDGTYAVTGNTIDVAAKTGGEEKKNKLTIKKLTETELEAADPEGKGATFMKAK